MVLMMLVKLMVLMVLILLMAMIVLMLLIVPVRLMLMVVKSQDHFDTIAVIDEGTNGCRCWAIFRLFIALASCTQPS